MPIIASVIVPATTKAQYDAVRAECNWLGDIPVGGMAHLTWWEGDDCHNMDAWESAEALDAFVTNRLGPAMAKAGVTSEPIVAVHDAHEVFLPKAQTVTATAV